MDWQYLTSYSNFLSTWCKRPWLLSSEYLPHIVGLWAMKPLSRKLSVVVISIITKRIIRNLTAKSGSGAFCGVMVSIWPLYSEGNRRNSMLSALIIPSYPQLSQFHISRHILDGGTVTDLKQTLDWIQEFSRLAFNHSFNQFQRTVWQHLRRKRWPGLERC